MFSYRHGFHAGNHADVLKHTTLIAILRHLAQKEAALTVIDTHAGAGLYRLDGDYAHTSGEAADGIARLDAAAKPPGAIENPSPSPLKHLAADALAPALRDYLELVRGFNTGGGTPKVYPGSPFVIERLLRPQDRLKLFEMHPADAKALEGNIAQLDAGRQIVVSRGDGFAAPTPLLPPPSRRALLLCDPSYEMKIDYARVQQLVAESLRRFATGTYAVWYPVVPRPEAHDLPRKLKSLATQSGKPWLHATLSIGMPLARELGERPGLTASGMFVINPPHTLKPALAAALPQMLELLARGAGHGQKLETGG
jgi:23S rRNA (adenine2030-N6)-methyltransferase